ncbi:MAG: hypothetical protein GY738_26390, partial [Pseudoalteromonas sp.]|nr:hypothetical protein [Pseudoalteromonas sp.]
GEKKNGNPYTEGDISSEALKNGKTGKQVRKRLAKIRRQLHQATRPTEAKAAAQDKTQNSEKADSDGEEKHSKGAPHRKRAHHQAVEVTQMSSPNDAGVIKVWDYFGTPK